MSRRAGYPLSPRQKAFLVTTEPPICAAISPVGSIRCYAASP